MSTVIITRKIQLNFVAKNKIVKNKRKVTKDNNEQEMKSKEIKDQYKKWYGWQRIIRQGANLVSSHLYVQDQVKTFVYLTEKTIAKLGIATEADPNGLLNTTQRNSTYRLLSGLFLGSCPTGMLSGLSDAISKAYKEEKSDIWKGLRAIRNYKNDIPLPIRFADIGKWVKLEDGNYMFDVYGTRFKTYFGKDLSKNEFHMDMAMRGEYKLCDSAIQLDGRNIYLLAVLKKPKNNLTLDPEKVADCFLSLEYPIIIKQAKDKFFNIGSAQDYLHKRLQIKEARRRSVMACKHNHSSRGRKKKFQSTERFEKTEKNFTERKMHEYSKRLIDYCIKNGCGKIVLNNYQEVVDKTHENTEEAKFLLASWGYFGLGTKIKYKAAQEGIVVEIN